MRLYENPQKTSENRLKQRSWYIPEGSEFCTLNGEWRFVYFENGDRAGEPAEWGRISVHACWQLMGFDTPNYSNISYPFPCDPAYVPDINPVGIYERDFYLTDGSLVIKRRSPLVHKVLRPGIAIVRIFGEIAHVGVVNPFAWKIPFAHLIPSTRNAMQTEPSTIPSRCSTRFSRRSF